MKITDKTYNQIFSNLFHRVSNMLGDIIHSYNTLGGDDTYGEGSKTRNRIGKFKRTYADVMETLQTRLEDIPAQRRTSLVDRETSDFLENLLLEFREEYQHLSRILQGHEDVETVLSSEAEEEEDDLSIFPVGEYASFRIKPVPTPIKALGFRLARVKVTGSKYTSFYACISLILYGDKVLDFEVANSALNLEEELEGKSHMYLSFDSTDYFHKLKEKYIETYSELYDFIRSTKLIPLNGGIAPLEITVKNLLLDDINKYKMLLDQLSAVQFKEFIVDPSSVGVTTYSEFGGRIYDRYMKLVEDMLNGSLSDTKKEILRYAGHKMITQIIQTSVVLLQQRYIWRENSEDSPQIDNNVISAMEQILDMNIYILRRDNGGLPGTSDLFQTGGRKNKRLKSIMLYLGNKYSVVCHHSENPYVFSSRGQLSNLLYDLTYRPKKVCASYPELVRICSPKTRIILGEDEKEDELEHMMRNFALKHSMDDEDDDYRKKRR